MLQQYYWTLLLNGWFIKDLEKLVCLQWRGQLPSYLLEFLNHQPWKEFLMIYVKQEWTLFLFNSPHMAPLNSSSSHNKKMKTSRHISKSLTKKCSTWRIYLNSLSPKSKSMESTTIFLSKLSSTWNKQWKTTSSRGNEHDQTRTPSFLAIKSRIPYRH